MLQPIKYGIEIECGERFNDECPQRLAVFDALEVGRETFVFRQFRSKQYLVAKQLPLSLVLQTQHYCGAVTDWEGTIWVDRGVRGAGARGRCSAVVGVVHRVVHPLDQAFQHGHIEVATFASASTQQQGRQNSGVGVHAGRDVSN
ncbi:hypothetical protein D3C73_1290610 [compost metagenome]